MIKKLIILFFAFSIISCGGSSTDKGTSDPYRTGVFRDSPVQGLYYECGCKTGITDSEGQFEYEVGQECMFYIGNDRYGILLGTGIPSSIMTPVDLDPNASDETNSVVKNITSLLLTLDADANANNGIVISDAAREKASNPNCPCNLNFHQTATAFQSDPNTALLLAYFGTDSGSSILVSSDTAESHLKNTLLECYAGVYTGVYSGDDEGSFTLTFDSEGTITGTAASVNNPQYDGVMSGTVNSNGTCTISALVDIYLITFTGEIADYHVLSGTWSVSIYAQGIPLGGGTFEGRKN
ncbi:MAG: hypothetical protein ACMUJM_03905 [bacterium]